MGVTTAERVRSTHLGGGLPYAAAHPYPTPLDDCVAAYRALLDDHRPLDIVVGGASAGRKPCRRTDSAGSR